jgi:hypothetical protein
MSAFGGKADMTLCENPLSRSLLGVKRTWVGAPHMSAFDPKRDIRPVAQRPVPELPPDPSDASGILSSRSLLTIKLEPRRLELLHLLRPDAAAVAMLIKVSHDR